jgi:hypothetical protein
MRSLQHKRHLAENMSHSNCSECRADTERAAICVTWRELLGLLT